MQTTQPAYFSQYRSLKLTLDAKGVLVVEFHSNGRPLTFTAQDHTEFVDAFYRISQDRANQIVILTGTNEAFIAGIDFPSLRQCRRSRCVESGTRRGCSDSRESGEHSSSGDCGRRRTCPRALSQFR
jgi:enoyl-CoA hydratase/carnithine racemase